MKNHRSTRKKEAQIALAMGQARNFNPAINPRSKGSKDSVLRSQPESYRGFFGWIHI